MKELIYLSLFVFIVYNIFTWIYLGIQKSISDTVYKLPKGKKWLFNLFIVGITVPILFYIRDYSLFSFGAAIFILMVFFTADTKANETRSANHVIGATGGILLAYLGFGLEYFINKWFGYSSYFIDWAGNWWFDVYFIATILFLLSTIVILPIKGIKKGIPKHTTWIEITAYMFWVLPIIIDKFNLI